MSERKDISVWIWKDVENSKSEGEFSERLANWTAAAGVTKRSGGVSLNFQRWEWSEGSEKKKERRGYEKRTNENGMIIFGHNGIKDFKTKGVKKGMSSIINAQT